ncbi:MAG TPA: tetratricopeptide repeat protein, partial [Thermoguttaceae bacterium]|nr:tetratricopeptide repeat protein [Thermoguttaceae bacterium]
DELLESKSASAEIEQHALVLACRIDAADQRWDKVRDSAERLLKKHPDSSLHLVAEFWAAESLYRRDDYEKAAARLDRLMPEVQGRRETWTAMIPLRRAQIFAFDKQWKEAEERASTIQRDYPGFERQYEVDYLLGRCEAAQAEFSAARQAYRRAIQSPEGAKTETAAMAQWMIGETYFHQQNHEAALREYLRVEILYDFPRWQAAAVLQAGKCYERLNRPDEAAKQFRRVVEQYPVSPFVEEARNRLAAAAGPGKTSEAREAKRHPASAARRQ